MCCINVYSMTVQFSVYRTGRAWKRSTSRRRRVLFGHLQYQLSMQVPPADASGQFNKVAQFCPGFSVYIFSVCVINRFAVFSNFLPLIENLCRQLTYAKVQLGRLQILATRTYFQNLPFLDDNEFLLLFFLYIIFLSRVVSSTVCGSDQYTKCSTAHENLSLMLSCQTRHQSC